MKKNKTGPNMAKWKDYRIALLKRANESQEEADLREQEAEQLTENFLGVRTMKPINRNAPEIQETARKFVAQIETDVAKILELIEIANSGLNEGNVPDSKIGNAIMQLASRVGALAGQMWK